MIKENFVVNKHIKADGTLSKKREQKREKKKLI